MRCQTSIWLVAVFSSAASGDGVAAGCIAVDVLVIEAEFTAAMVLLADVDSVDGVMTGCGATETDCGAEATGIIFFVSEVIC